MAEESNKLTVKASEKGAEVSVSGEGVDRLTNALADLLSPFSQSAGALGDVVRAYRIENAIRALSRAKELANELGADINPVPPKFLVQWTEAVSLEDESEEDLTGLWAGLLVSASSSLEPTHYLFKRVLSEMTFRHIEFFVALCDEEIKINGFDRKKLVAGTNKWNATFNDPEAAVLTSLHAAELMNVAKKSESYGSLIKSCRVGEFIDTAQGEDFVKLLGKQEVFVQDLSSYRIIQKCLASSVDEQILSFMSDRTLDHLVSCNLIREIQNNRKVVLNDRGLSQNLLMEITALNLTSLGKLFLLACSGKSLKENIK